MVRCKARLNSAGAKLGFACNRCRRKGITLPVGAPQRFLTYDGPDGLQDLKVIDKATASDAHKRPPS